MVIFDSYVNVYQRVTLFHHRESNPKKVRNPAVRVPQTNIL